MNLKWLVNYDNIAKHSVPIIRYTQCYVINRHQGDLSVKLLSTDTPTVGFKLVVVISITTYLVIVAHKPFYSC